MRRTMLATMLLFACVVGAWAQTRPQATISNQQIRVKMYLPDPVNGFFIEVAADAGKTFTWQSRYPVLHAA
jgi:hypothetical protein